MCFAVRSVQGPKAANDDIGRRRPRCPGFTAPCATKKTCQRSPIIYAYRTCKRKTRMSQNEPRVQPLIRLAQIIVTPPRFAGDPAALDNGERAALARLDPEAMRPHQVAALVRALLAAGIDPAEWRGDTW